MKSTMATQIELTSPLPSRAAQSGLSEILNEARTPRTHVSPLSDASNKSNDSILTSSLILEETSRPSSKSVSMFNTGTRPRLSPKPFSKDKPADFREIRKLVEQVPKSCPTEVPYQKTSTIFLSSSLKNEGERVGRQIYRSSPQPNNEEDQSTKAEAESFTATTGTRRSKSSSWVPLTNTVDEYKSTSRSEEFKSSSKPEIPFKPMVATNKPDVSQSKEIPQRMSKITTTDAADEKLKTSSINAENVDSSSVRSQLRPKRRPFSVYLDSITEPSQEKPNTVGGVRRPRPLSVDLTAKFESKSPFVHQKGSALDETKENIPLKKSTVNTSAVEEKPELGTKEEVTGSFHTVSNKNIGSDMRKSEMSSEVDFLNLYCESLDKGIISKTDKGKSEYVEQEITDVGENQGIIKLSESANQQNNLLVQQKKYNNDNSASEVQQSDESGIAPGTIKRRISLLLSNSSSSVEIPEGPTAEEKESPNIQQRSKTFDSENVDVKSHTVQTTSHSYHRSTDFTKLSSSPPSNVERRAEKMKEAPRVTQDFGNLKDKVEQKNNAFSEDRQCNIRRSFRKLDGPPQFEDSVFVPKESIGYSYKCQDSPTGDKGARDNIVEPADSALRTVRATVYEYNVERHSVAKVYHTKDVRPNQLSKSESIYGKSGDLTDHLEDGVYRKVQHHSEISNIGSSKTSQSVQENISSNIMSTQNTHKNVEVDLINKRIEPRYEIMQTVGERVLSESIKRVPEDKAVTLRSQRSFHRKDTPEMDVDFSDHPLSKLRRSKSEYRKRNTQDNAQGTSKDKSFITDFDVQLEKMFRFRPEVNLPIKSAVDNSCKSEGAYPTDKSKTLVPKIVSSNFQEKTVKTETAKIRRENKFGTDSQTQDTMKTVENSTSQMLKECQPVIAEQVNRVTQVRDLKRQTYQTSKDPAEKPCEFDFDQSLKTNLKYEELLKTSTQISNRKNETYQLHRSSAKYDSEPVKINTIKEESSDIIKLMLNQDIQQLKRELTDQKSGTDINRFQMENKIDNVFAEDHEWMRGSISFHDGNNTSTARTRTSDFIKYADEEAKIKNIHLESKDTNQDSLINLTMKDISPLDTKATYFAVTYMDKKKEKCEKDFENQNTIGSVTSDGFRVKQDVKVHELYTSSQKDLYGQEINVVKEGLENAVALPQHKANRRQNVVEEDLIAMSNEKSSQNIRHDIDIDDLLNRRRQRLNMEEKSSAYRDPYVKPSPKDHEIENSPADESRFSHLDPKGSYRSKVVDIDALMVGYKTKQQKCNEDKLVDLDDQVEYRWNRSRSARESSEKITSNKWKDPSKKLFTSDDGYKYEYKSREITSRQELKGENTTDSTTPVIEAGYDKFLGRTRDTGINSTESNQTVRPIDAMPESSRRVRVDNRPRSSMIQDSLEIKTEVPMRHTSTSKSMYVELSVDNDNQENGKFEHVSSTQTEMKTISAESQSERRRPAKASDLINLMLEDRERRKEQHRVRQSLPVEHAEQPRKQRPSSQQDWELGDKKEISLRHSTRLREKEIVAEPSPRRIKNHSRHMLQDELSQQDQLKQCFSRPSTNSKDTDSLVQEPERQYGTWNQEQQQTEDSIVHDSPSYSDLSSRKQAPHSRLSSLSQTETDQHDSITDHQEANLDVSSMDIDSTDGTESTASFQEAKTDFSFIDQTSVLDSTALKNRVQLSRKSQRRAPSQAQRKSRLFQSSGQLAVIEDTDSPWMYTDTTEEKPEKEETDEEEKPQRTPVHQQRMPVFPGMDPSALKAQLRKRQDPENTIESPTHPSRSPKSPLPQGTLGIKLLPTLADKQDRGAEESPQWLKELKSKKRLSQYENNT